MRPLLLIDDLAVDYELHGVKHRAVQSVTFAVHVGEAIGIVGESGSGKSTIAQAILGSLPENGRIGGGAMRFEGISLVDMSERERRPLRRHDIAFVPQGTAAALNPARTVGSQLLEVARVVHGERRAAARGRVLDMIARVQLPEPERVATLHPHQLSGGMRQRALIAMALLHEPKLLVLDEPTSGLDATVEAGVLDLLCGLQATRDMAMLLITHSFHVLTRVCGRTLVMYDGRLVESGETQRVVAAPSHPYTRDLIDCIPDVTDVNQHRLRPSAAMAEPMALEGCSFVRRCAHAHDRCSVAVPELVDVGQGHQSRCFLAGVENFDALNVPVRYIAHHGTGAALLSLVDVRLTYTTGRRVVTAVSGVSFDLLQGQRLGLVGESGSGKSSIARMIAGLQRPTAGSLYLSGERLPTLVEERTGAQRRRVQMVFQDARGSLNPARSVREIIGAAVAHGAAATSSSSRVAALLDMVQLPAAAGLRRPHELSGGQAQRVAIARAFAMRPELLICDEVVSALDVSVQAVVLNLLHDLSAEQGVALLFISHDLGVVRYLCDDVVIMASGSAVEAGPVDQVFDQPTSDYAARLVAAATTRPIAELSDLIIHR